MKSCETTRVPGLSSRRSLHGFINRDIRSRLTGTRWLRGRADDPKKAGAKVDRCFRRLHGTDTRGCGVTSYGRNVMGTSLYLREHRFPNVYTNAAAA